MNLNLAILAFLSLGIVSGTEYIESENLLCDDYRVCKNLTVVPPTELCSRNSSIPCLDSNSGNAIFPLGEAYQTSRVKRSIPAWFQPLYQPIGASYGAYNAWKNFITFCVDCPPSDVHCYGDWACVVSALSTVGATAWAMYSWALLAATLAKRDEGLDIETYLNSHVESSPVSFDFSNGSYQLKKRSNEDDFDVHEFSRITVNVNGSPQYTMNATVSSQSGSQVSLNFHEDYKNRFRNSIESKLVSKRDYRDEGHQVDNWGGLKYSYCPVHPEHHLTAQYDWDTIWAMFNEELGTMSNYYYTDIGLVDMNDYVSGGWRVLIGTGQLVLESSTGFGHEFETCDRNSFDQLAR